VDAHSKGEQINADRIRFSSDRWPVPTEMEKEKGMEKA